VVFDGRDRGLQATRASVAFAPHADDLIAARAAPGVTVVTSDRELAERSRAEGAGVIGAGAFLRRLG
jgi:rRNA-processing protein FCF1